MHVEWKKKKKKERKEKEEEEEEERKQISLFIVCSFSIVLYYKSECYIMQASMLFAPHHILLFDFNTAWLYQCMCASKFLTVYLCN